MKIRTHAIKSLYLAAILGLPGCVLFPQVDDNLAPVVVPVERNELSTVVKSTTPKESKIRLMKDPEKFQRFLL